MPQTGGSESSTLHLAGPLYVLDELQFAAGHLVDLYDAGTARPTAHNHELCAAWYPLGVEQRVVHRFFYMADYLRLCQLLHVNDQLSTLLTREELRRIALRNARRRYPYVSINKLVRHLEVCLTCRSAVAVSCRYLFLLDVILLTYLLHGE